MPVLVVCYNPGSNEMKHSDIQKMKLPLCSKCGTQTVLYKRGDSFFEYCENCKEENLIAFCTEYDKFLPQVRRI